MKILVVNSGSSSIKYQLFNMRTDTVLVKGLLERIGESSGQESHQLLNQRNEIESFSQQRDLPDHQSGVRRIAEFLQSSGALSEDDQLAGIAHRVAHGGAHFQEATSIDAEVIRTIRSLIPLAPLHNPANLLGIEMTMEMWPETPQVAVFDTAFHHTMPEYAYQYALPHELAHHQQVRRYGFHGTSHRFVSEQAARLMGRSLGELNLIVLHLGNGASVTAVQSGKSIDTSMGMTPLEGLIMGTRCGDVDPGALVHLAGLEGMKIDELDALLNRQSGLKGICGANDMREVVSRQQQGDPLAILAIEMYCYRIKKYIGAYAAALGRLDAVVYTAGIGEHNPIIRTKSCTNLQQLGIHIDEQKNEAVGSDPAAIHSVNSAVQVWVIPTNEELEMARQALQCLSN